MNLISEEEKKKEGKSKKIIAISIVALVIALVILLAVMFAIKQSIDEEAKLSVDGKKYKMPVNLMITQGDTTYLSINTIAVYTNYQFFNGGYKEYTEDKTRGYVQCENEIASFIAGSNVMYKNNAQDKLNFDYYELESPIISYEDTLYASMNDIGKIFNSQVFFKQSENTLVVQTMPYLISYYKTKIAKYGYEDVSEDFNTQKAVNYGMLVVKKDNSYGVISTENFSVIIGTKYEKMIYLESLQQFIVTSDGKTGLISANGDKIIDVKYDDVGLIDTKCGLYYAKNNDLMGVLNTNGKVVVNLEYNALGLDRKNFPYDSIKHNMFLYDNCIPIMKYEIKTGVDKDGKPVEIKIEKWGLSDKLGNILLTTQYDNLGYVETNTSDRSINNVIIIPKIKGIVIGKEGKYGVVNSIGKLIIPYEFDKIYSITTEGKDEFYLEQDGKTIKLDKYITDNKIEVEDADYNYNNGGNSNSNVININTEETPNTIVVQDGTTTTIVM